jgi:hypothetical protein
MYSGGKPVFSGLRNRWREARADVAEKEAADILSRYERLGGYERYVLSSAFDYTKTDLEIEHGEFAGWRSEDKVATAKKLMESARRAFRAGQAFRTRAFLATVERTDIVTGASDLALLSLYLEAQTLPGEQAKRLVSSIADWHMRAVEKDLHHRGIGVDE